MASGSSVAQIVRKIIDDLSDGVSELVLLVVVLSEQNAPIPDQLPPASEIVNNTARGLARIARELANSDYVDFKDIATEIHEASDAVDAATKGMDQAVAKLKAGTGDRKQGWNALVDNCRIMSGKTIRLLQIVYGADLKRLQLTADQLRSDIGNFNSGNVKNNQQKFADDIQPLINKALKLANYVNDRSNDQESPYSRDLLRKAADGLRDAANEVVAAGNAALQNPELAPKVDEALDKLKRAIGDAQKLVDETADEGPAMKKLGRIQPLLERAIAAVEAVPPAARSGDPAKYQRAEKEVKEAVAPLVKQLKINPKTKRDAGNVEDGLTRQLLGARSAMRGEPNDLDDATKWLLDALKGLRKLDPNSGETNPDDLNEFQKALANLRKTLGPELYPDAKEQAAWERLLDNIQQTRKAVQDEDPEKGRNNLKQMWGNGNDLAKEIAGNKDKHPTARYERQNQAAKDLVDELLPRVIRKGKPSMDNIGDKDAAEDLLDALRRLRRGMGRMEPADEKDMRDNWLDILKNLRKVRADAEKGLPVDEGLKAIQNALKNLRKAAERRALQHPDSRDAIMGPANELQNLGDRFGNEAKGKDLPAMDKTIPQMEDAWRRLDRAAHASDVGAVQDLEDAIEDTMAAIDLGDASRLAPAARDTLAKMDIVGDLVKKIADPESRKIGENAMNILRPGIRDFLETGKKAVQNPEERKWVDQAADIKDRLKAPLADLKEAFDPTAKDRIAEGAGAAVKRAMEELRKANESGDPERIRQALKNLREALDRYNGIINGQIQDIDDPGRKKVLEHEKKALDDLRGDVARADPTNKGEINLILDSTPTVVDDFMRSMRNTEADDAIRAAARAANMASLGDLDDDMDLGDLLGTAGQLSSLLRGMVNHSGDMARDLGTSDKNVSAAAKAALALDRTIRRLEGLPDEVEVQEEALAPPPAPVAAPPPPPLVESTVDEEVFHQPVSTNTVEDLMSQVAYEIHQQAKAVSAEADKIAEALARLANAARAGDRAEMLRAAKEVSAHIIAFTKELTELSKRIPGKNAHERREADRLVRAGTGLRTFATQLKILCSVKAASIEQNRDNDETLGTVTRNLGEILSQGLTSMSAIQKTILRV